jgi:alpha-ketoglutaric semialdehyde dehydrogenase
LTDLHGNTIGGERVPARGGGTFEAKSGRYARSGAPDVEAAILAADKGEDGWWGLSAAARREILVRAARDLAHDPDPGGRLALRLGLSADELSFHFQDLPERLGRALDEPAATFADPRIRQRGLLVHAPAWAELVSGPASAIFSALALGRTILVVSDPVAPTIAESISDALARAGLPDGVLGVLHDDGEDALRAALGSSAPTFVLASGFPERIQRLERMTTRPGGARFGAGLSDDSGTAIDLRILGTRSAVVAADADLARRAAEIAEAAFGRARTLSGQLPGQLGRASIHPRVFSRFTEELLAVLRASADLASPVPVVDAESEAELRRARVLGLDEGATLIFTTAASPDDDEDGILAPSVFTNVEERMRLASLARPASILCLLRGDAPSP